MEETKNGTVYSGRTSSWALHPTTAKQFAITWPTYHFNRELAYAEQTRTDNHEWMLGYRGVILKYECPANIAIDLNGTDLVYEDEIILPRGTYAPIAIVEEFKPFSQEINKDNFEEQFKAIKSLSSSDYEEFDKQKFRYILHHFQNNFSDEARRYLAKVIGIPAKGECLDEYRPYNDKYSYRTAQYLTHDNIPYNLLTYYGLLMPEDQQRVVNLVNQVWKQRINKLNEAFASGADIGNLTVDMNGSVQFEKTIADPALVQRFKKLINDRVGEAYRGMSKEVTDINRITDENEQRKAINNYRDKVERIMKNIVAGFQSKFLQ
jgi:hypothetical protein